MGPAGYGSAAGSERRETRARWKAAGGGRGAPARYGFEGHSKVGFEDRAEIAKQSTALGKMGERERGGGSREGARREAGCSSSGSGPKSFVSNPESERKRCRHAGVRALLSMPIEVSLAREVANSATTFSESEL